MADTESTANAATGGITLPLYALLPPAVKQILLLVGLAAAIAAGVAMVFWSQGENYTPLYSGLADRDIGEITAQLDSAELPYELDPGDRAALLVPADRKYEVRMQLASSGLPRGAGFGIEEMPERSSFGQTPFMENALYVRAVETELARTIGSMQPVEMARVHLALAAAVGLLAAEARAERVRDAEAVLGKAPRRGASAVRRAPRRFERARSRAVARHGRRSNRRTADEPERRRDDEPHRARSSITASRSRATTRSAFRARSARSSAPIACAPACRPKSISRRPSRRARASIRTCSWSAASKRTKTRAAATACRACPARSAISRPRLRRRRPAPTARRRPKPSARRAPQTRNFELDKTVSHTRAAVGVDSAACRSACSSTTSRRQRATAQPIPLTEQEIASLTDIVRQAVGFDEARGDTISVVNSAFQPVAAARGARPRRRSSRTRRSGASRAKCSARRSCSRSRTSCCGR